MKVHILATVRREELLPYTTLVFKSLRVGFPTADIHVTANNLEVGLSEVQLACASVGASFENGPETIHQEWIKKLLNENEESFWICDTDQVFWDSMEQWANRCPEVCALWGRRVPEFRDESTGYITRSRLHTSLLWLNPELIKERLEVLYPKGEIAKFAPFARMVDPIVTMHKGKGIFYDTCSHLFHAVGGTPFTEDQLNCYDHFHAGTIPDLIIPNLRNGEAMLKERAKLIENPVLLKNAWRTQDAWYEARQV